MGMSALIIAYEPAAVIKKRGSKRPVLLSSDHQYCIDIRARVSYTPSHKKKDLIRNSLIVKRLIAVFHSGTHVAYFLTTINKGCTLGCVNID